MPNLVVSAVAKWNGTALKKGERQLTQFQKTTNALAKSFAAAFAVRKIVQFGKASVQAFAADEKAAKSLSIALQNTGNGFATIATEGFIARMQDTYKVLDDELRPAFQTILTATGSLTKAQEGLQLALDVSAGTTKDLASVSAALAKGYSGQTTALSRLGAGLDKATLKSGDMEKIISVLSARFSGQALGSLDTYAKKMDALSVAAANSKEIIGKGLLDSIAALGSADGLTKATTEMEKFAQSSADALLGLSTLLGRLKGSGVGTAVSGAFSGFMNSGLLAKIGKEQRLKNAPYSSTSMYFTAETAERAKLIATIKKGNAVEKEKNKLTAAELAEKKKQAELDALKKKFDVERINLETALLNSKDEAEKARIRSLLTIMDEDANSAAKRMAELDKANADRLKKELDATKSINDLAVAAGLAAAKMGLILSGGPIPGSAQVYPGDFGVGGAVGEEINPNISNYPSTGMIPGSTQVYPGDFGVGGVAGMAAVNNITINTPLGSEDALTEAVQKAVQQLNRYGYSQTYAGALPTP